MSSVWPGAIASLSGVVVGAFATYFIQVRLWKRTTRRELYGNFVGVSNVGRDQLLDVAYAIRRELPESERNDRWEKANAQMALVSSLAAQVSMVASGKTREAAEALEGYLSGLKAELHVHNRDGTPPQQTSDYLDAYHTMFIAFVDAASKELGITRTVERIRSTKQSG